MAEMKHPARLDSQVSADAQPIHPSMPLPTVETGSLFEEDREAATKFRDHLQNDIILERERRVTAVLYDDEELESLSGSKVQSLDNAFERCTFTFIFITKSFIKNQFSKISSEGCLMESLDNSEKQWRAVPVYTVSREERDFRIPIMFKAFKGVNYYRRDAFYRNGLRRTIGDRVMVRINKNRELLEKQYQCACEIRDMECARNIAEKRAIKGNQGLLNTENENQNGEGSIRSTVPSSLDGASSCKSYSEHKEEHLNPSLQGNPPQSPLSDSERELSTMDSRQAQKETVDLSNKMQGCSLRQLSDLQGEKSEDDEDLMEDGQPQYQIYACYNNGKVKDNEEDVTSYVDTENAGTDIDRGNGEQHRKTTDSACLYADVENLYHSNLSNSIGCIEVCGISCGTGFRVGSKYVMTAYHVVEDILKNLWKEVYERLTLDERKLLKWTKENKPCDGRWSLNDLIQRSSMGNEKAAKLRDIERRCITQLQIKFRLVRKNQNHVDGHFSGDVAFASAVWDVAILELVEDNTLSEPIKLMNTYVQFYDLHIMGYSKGGYLKYDPKCAIIKDKRKLSDLVEKGTDFFVNQGCNIDMVREDYKLCVLSPDHILFHCSKSTAHGASGSPLLVSSDPPQVAGMLLKGHPKFYYNLIHDNKKMGERLDLLVESGISMEKVFYLLKEHFLDDLANELFIEWSSN